jgi:hypothetical protein
VTFVGRAVLDRGWMKGIGDVGLTNGALGRGMYHLL